MAESSTPTILITGGTGFAGSHLVELLLESHQKESIHVTSYSANQNFVHALLPSENIHQLDLRNHQDTLNLLTKLQPTQIYHLAAIAQVGGSYEKASEVFSNNFGLQFSLLEAIRTACPTTRTLVIGSAQEYDVIATAKKSEAILSETDQIGPSNPYGVSKVAQDLLALSYFYSYKLPILRARPFNHIGERQELGFAVSDFSNQIVAIEKGVLDVIKVGNLSAVRDFTDVKDMVKAYQIIMETGTIGEVYNIGSGQGSSLQFILDTLIKLSGKDVRIEIDQAKLRPLDVESIVANSDKLKSLGWKAEIPLEETLQRVLNFWRSKE